MPTPADERLLEVLEKWLQSLALHERYAGLDADSYARVQPWPTHQRPSRWIIDLGRQKTLALRAQLEQRMRAGDAQFSEALELMAFLANLVGSEHIERFIPLATPENEQPLARARPSAPEADEPAPAAPRPRAPEAARVPAGRHAPAAAHASTARAPAAQAPAAPAPAARAPPVRGAPPTAAHASTPADNAPTREMPMAPITSSELLTSTANREMPGVSVTATREMPQFKAGGPRAAAPPPGTPHVARAERRPAAARAPAPAARAPAPSARPAGKAAARQPARMPPAAKPHGHSHARDHQVVADAARLMQWGRKWHELAELIARMADRPALPEVRRILKDNKTAIEKKAGRG